MTVSYLDVDDEITDAVARLRTADGRRLILVLPPGSRVGTSRINFRLLAREGQERSITVALVSTDASVRSLATSAGLPAYGSVQEAEASVTPSAAGPSPARATVGPTMQAAPRPPAGRRPDLEGTQILPRSSASGATPGLGTPVASSPPPSWETDVWRDPSGARSARARGRKGGAGLTGWLIRGAVLLAILAVGAYLAYLTLPNVTITVRPTTTAAGPLSVAIIADRSAAVIDPVAGIVPAEIVDIPLVATDDFDATGSRIEETRATGRAVLVSENTVAVVVVAAGSLISTASGVEFETLEQASVPQADFDDQTPGRASVRVRAVRPGTGGNVPAGTITRLPAEYADQQVEASNLEPTSGGSRREVAVVTSADYQDALADLERRLDGQLEGALADPATTPSGFISFPESAVQEATVATPASAEVVDKQMESFTLTAESVGTVLAVDESLVAQLAADRLAESITGGARLFPDSIATDLGEPEVADDGRIAYAASVTGEQYQPPDQPALIDAVRGRTVGEARVILAAYGAVEIRPWPDFIGTVPDDPRRISVTVLEPQRSSP